MVASNKECLALNIPLRQATALLDNDCIPRPRRWLRGRSLLFTNLFLHTCLYMYIYIYIYIYIFVAAFLYELTFIVRTQPTRSQPSELHGIS